MPKTFEGGEKYVLVAGKGCYARNAWDLLEVFVIFEYLLSNH